MKIVFCAFLRHKRGKHSKMKRQTKDWRGKIKTKKITWKIWRNFQFHVIWLLLFDYVFVSGVEMCIVNNDSGIFRVSLALLFHAPPSTIRFLQKIVFFSLFVYFCLLACECNVNVKCLCVPVHVQCSFLQKNGLWKIVWTLQQNKEPRWNVSEI